MKKQIADSRPEINALWEEYLCLKSNPCFLMQQNWRTLFPNYNTDSPYMLELKEKLIKAYLQDVQIIVAIIQRKRHIPSHIAYEELLSPAYEALIKMIDSYNPLRACFKTYMRTRIRGSVLDWLRSKDSRSAIVYEKNKYQAEEESTRDICDALHPNEVQNVPNRVDKEARLNLIRPIYFSILEEQCSKKHDKEIGRNIEFADYSEKDPSKQIEDYDFCEHLEKLAIHLGLSSWTSQIIRMYYFENKNMSEIARAIKRSESCVSLIHAAFIKKMKEFFKVAA